MSKWTIALLVLGLAAISVAVIVPQADANRRLRLEHQKLLADLDQFNRQSAVNEDFLKNIEDDPQLAQRLAQRQMKFIRQGESLLPFKRSAAEESAISTEVSPFSLVHIPPPPALPAYQPVGGAIGATLLDPHVQLYGLAGGLFLVAMGLILCAHEPTESRLGT